MGWVGHLLIAVWRDTPDTMVGMFRDEARRGIAERGMGLGHMPVVLAGCPPMSLEARRGLLAVARENRKSMNVFVPVVSPTGFLAGAVRAAGELIFMMLPGSQYRLKIASDVAEAARFLMTTMPDNDPRLTAGCLAGAVAALEERLADGARGVTTTP